ncbi:uncharacterized protein LOC119103015 [Pollicipes pollicipes]|uniref:uncharacterized protein LOC119103015 n=1 Tax=Pollicipes pollicipes TaxID=41117 RepID=UPI0018851DF2|nr:uncharacterized protein LOC119103015 [Pollicipes pollicipes]
MPIHGYDFRVMEKKLTCPFNPAHQVTDMQKHLTRCSSYNKDVSIKKCPFNATHWVREPEFRHHLDRCPDKAPVDRHVLAQRAGSSDGSSGDLTMPVTWAARNDPVQNNVDGWGDQLDDDWDVEVSNLPRHMRTKYDPQTATENREIFRMPTEHRGKSARNKFRQENVSRARAIQSGSVVDASEASSTVAPSTSSVGARRRPTTNPLCCPTATVNINPSLGMGRDGM